MSDLVRPRVFYAPRDSDGKWVFSVSIPRYGITCETSFEYVVELLRSIQTALNEQSAQMATVIKRAEEKNAP